jgi:integrase
MPKQSILFNDMYIRSLKPQEKPYMVTEASKERGGGRFCLKVTTAGEKDFYILYYQDDKRKLMLLGRYGVLSLKEARERFNEQSRLLRDGIAPQEHRSKEEQRKALEVKAMQEAMQKEKMQGSVGQLVDIWLEHLQRERSSRHSQNARQAIKADVLPVIDSERKANTIGKSDIIAVLHRIVARGSEIQANRTRSYLSAMFSFGIHFDDSVASITHGVKFHIEYNPVTAVQKVVKQEPVGERNLSEGEVYRFVKLLDKSLMDLPRKQVFMLMLATGQRVEAVSSAKWIDFDFDECLWTIPGSRTQKIKRAHVVPLNSVAMEILSEARSLNLNRTYCFPRSKGDTFLPLDGFSQSLSRLLNKTDMEAFNPRDIRRTVKTLMGKCGISKEIRDRLQNHALTDVSSKHYDKYDYLGEKRRAMQIWGQYLEQIMRGEWQLRNAQDNVVELKMAY